MRHLILNELLSLAKDVSLKQKIRNLSWHLKFASRNVNVKMKMQGVKCMFFTFGNLLKGTNNNNFINTSEKLKSLKKKINQNAVEYRI